MYKYAIVSLGDGNIIGTNDDAEARNASADSYFVVIDMGVGQHVDNGKLRPIESLHDRTKQEGAEEVDANDA